MNNFNHQHERQVIAGLLHDNTAYDTISLSPVDFHSPEYRDIYKAVCRVIDTGRRADVLSVADILAPAAVKILAKIDPYTAANISFYAGEVKELSRRRQIEQLIAELHEMKGQSSEELIEFLDSGITRLTDGGKQDIQWLKDILRPAVDEIEADFKAGGRLRGISSGFGDIDALTGGFRNGDLIIIGARPSVGKTALAMTMAVNMARKNTVVGFFSCEMSSIQLGQRILSGEARVNLLQIRNTSFPREQLRKIVTAANRLYRVPILIDDTPNITLVRLRNKARQMRRLGTQIIFVDYLTLVQHENKKIPMFEQVGDISKQLKGLARELDIPFVVMSQVNREAEGRMPNLSHLRMSGAIEEDADVIMFLYRERSGTETELEIAKQRNGPTDTVKLVFLPTCVRFESAA